MKPITAILFGMLLFMFFLTGCAGSPARTDENPSLGDQGQYEIISTPFGDTKRLKSQTDNGANATVAENTDLEEQESFEIVSTPFGYIKRKKQHASDAVAPAAASTSTPAAASTPAPAAVSIPAPAAPPATGAGTAAPVVVLTEKPVAQGPPEETDRISFDFDNADLDEVIRAMADFLKINYIVDPGVNGKVTIHTAGNLREADVFPIFYQTLEVNGLTAVKEGNVYRVLRLKDAMQMPVASRLTGYSEEMPPEERIVIQLIPLKFISAQEVTKLITPFLSAGGAIVSGGTSETLLVVDKGINILKILKLVEVFDVSVFEKTTYRFFMLQNTDVEDVSKVLKEILPLSAGSAKDEVKFIPIEWLNALLIVSSSPDDVFGRVDSLIRQLDIPSEGAQPQIHVYSVKNGMAVDLGNTLRAVFGGGGTTSKSTKRESVPTNPFAIGAGNKDASASATAAKPEATAGPAATTTGVSGTVRGDIRITDDEIRNALIIEATPGDYKIVKTIIDRLDALPRQVLIDLVIAEISLGQGTELGIEWTFKKADWTDTGSLAAAIGGSGLQYARGLSEKWQAALHALANDNKLKIISSPSILASDNKQATIDVTTEVPIPSTNYTYVTDGDNVLETSVQYRNTGVILEVTPHINEYGLVTMDISQEVSNVGSLMKVAGNDYYSFDKKNISTSLTVKHNQSIVIGGMISSQRKDASSGVPWLTKIPIIRWLTGTEKKEESKSELIVMITPHVITSLEDVDTVSEEFKTKIEGLMTVLK